MARQWRRRWFIVLALGLFISLLAAGSLYAETENSVLNITGGREGYTTSLASNPDHIPVLVIHPVGDTRLQDITFEIRVIGAKWDIASFRGIEEYGEVDQNGVFTPIEGKDAYLTGGQDTPGVGYSLKAGNNDAMGVVTLGAHDVVTTFEALYIPLLVEITSNPATLEIYDDFTNDITVDGYYVFASSAMSAISTQVRPGEITTFSQHLALPDITIRELVNRTISAGTMVLRAPSGYRWIDIDQIAISGQNTTGLGISTRELSVEGTGALASQNVLRLGLDINAATVPRSVTLGNLQLEAVPGNENYGPISLTISGCNISQETIHIADRVRAYYTFVPEDQPLPAIVAGDIPADATSARSKVLKVTFEEVLPGRWMPSRRLEFTFPEGIAAQAVAINTTNLVANLPRDTYIRRTNDNAFAYDGKEGGLWTLTAEGLTVQNASVLSDTRAKLELTFYVTAEDTYTGPVYLSVGGTAVSLGATALVAEVVEAAPVRQIALRADAMEMLVDGIPVLMDVAPYIENDRMMLPVRYVANALGLPPDSVRWDSTEGTVTIQIDGKEIILTIGSTEMLVDGAPTEIAQAPVISGDRAFLPFRVLGEQVLGVSVEWESDTGTAILYR